MNNSLSLCLSPSVSVSQNNQRLSHAINQSYTHKSSAVSPLLFSSLKLLLHVLFVSHVESMFSALHDIVKGLGCDRFGRWYPRSKRF
jgi:hypothetical protein